MGSVETDRNLIFGTLALQMGFVTRDALIAAMNGWMVEKPKPLGQILVEQGALSPSRREILDRLVGEHEPRDATERAESDDGELRFVTEPADGKARPETTSATDAASDTLETWIHVGVPDPPVDDAERFVVLRPLAHGGIGQVSVALDREVHREVALKEILPEQADRPESRARFLLEAEVTGRLEHPGVVPLYGLGQTREGRPFYAMRLVKGQTLKQEIARLHDQWRSVDAAGGGRQVARWVPELRQLLNRFIAVCDTVTYAHSRGVIHRDLKPANILLGPYGETLVVDWGLAKVVGRSESPDSPHKDANGEATLLPSSLSGTAETLPGSAVGTPAFMSPEQAEGRLDRIGPASDVYSLGATLYCILMGRPPFDDEHLSEVFLKIRVGEFPRPRQVDPRLPAALEAVCLKAMAVDPKARYPSPRALADDLERWLADEPIPGHPEPFSTRATRWARRRRTAAVGIGSLLVAAVAALTISTALIGREQAETERQRLAALGHFREARRQGNLAAERAREAGEKARSLERQLYINRVNLALREAAGDVAQAEASLDLCPSELRGWEWRFLNRYGHLEDRSLAGFSESVNSVAFSPDGTRVLTGSGKRYYGAKPGDDADVSLWDATTGRLLRRFEGLKGNPGAVAFSPDGARIAAGTEIHGRGPASGRLAVWNAETGRVELDRSFEGTTVLAVAFSPDSRTLAAGLGRYSTDAPGRLTLWDLSTGTSRADLPSPPGGVNAVTFSPDGTTLASASSGVVELWDVSGAGKDAAPVKRRELRGHTDWVYALAFRRDGKRLATGGWDKTIRFWDVETGQPVQSIGVDATVLALAYHPDGRHLAVARESPVVELWDLADGRLDRQYRGHVGRVTSVAFRHDGKRLVTGSEDHTAKLWDLDAASPAKIPAHDGWVTSLSFTRDGTRLATGSGDRTVAIWDPVTWQRLDSTKFGEWVTGVALSPDGRHLAVALMDSHVQLWSTSPLKPLHVWQSGLGFPQCVAFSPDGKVLAYGTGAVNVRDAQTGDVILRDVDTGRVLQRLEHPGSVFAIAFAPGGRTLASAGGHRVQHTGELRLWEVDTGRHVRSFDGHTDLVRAVAFDRDGRRLVSAGLDRTARIWDVASGQPVFRIQVGSAPLHCVALSPDGSRLATGDEAGAIKLFDPALGDEILTLPGSASYTVSLAFSPDGRRLLSGAIDRSIRVWDSGPPRSSAGR